MKKITTLSLILLCLLTQTVFAGIITVPIAGKSYNIVHSSGLLLSEGTTYAQIMTKGSTAARSQSFKFVAVSGQTGVYNIQSDTTANFLGFTSYNTQWVTPASTATQVKIAATSNGLYVSIQFVGKAALGTDGTANAAVIYTDKSATATNSNWNLIVVGSPIKTSLNAAITTVTKKLASTTVNVPTGIHSQATRDALSVSLIIAQSIYDNENATQAEVDQAITDLYDALAAYTNGETFYLIHSTTGLYLSQGATNANIMILGNTGAVSQVFKFLPISGQNGMYNVQATTSGKYLAFSGFNTTWASTTSSATTIQLVTVTDSTFNIKFTGNGALGADSKIDGGVVFSNKGGDPFKMLLITGLAVKTALQAAITVATTKLANTTVGTGPGQYSQDVRDALTAVLTTAQGINNKTDATQKEVNQAVSDLNAALVTYTATSLTQGQTYNIVHTSGNYLTEENKLGAISDILTAGGATALSQAFSFAPVTGESGVYSIKSASGKYLAYSGSSANWSATVTNNTKVRLIDTSDGKLNIRFVNAGCLGTDGTTSGSTTWADKDGSNINHKWTLTQITLPATIATVTAKLSNTTVGTAVGQYPQAAKEALSTSLSTAQVVNANTSATRAEVNQAVTVLNMALVTYAAAQIVPTFAPIDSIAYRIGNLYEATYLTNTSGSILGTALRTDTINGGQLWKFEKVDGKENTYFILNGGKSLSAAAALEPYNKNFSAQWTIKYYATTNSIIYYTVQTITKDTLLKSLRGNTWATDVFSSTYNAFQIKFVAGNLLESYIPTALGTLKSAIIGSGIGEYTQEIYNTYATTIANANTLALSASATDAARSAKLTELKAAEATFKISYNGYGFDLTAMNAAIDKANALLETTTVVGNDPGKCPQNAIDALTAAIKTAKVIESGLNQTGIDAKTTMLNTDIATFKTALITSTGLASLLEFSLASYANATEGTDPGQYADGSKASFYLAIQAAQAAIAKEPLIQADLAAAYLVLQAAADIFNGTQVPAVDTRDLEAAIANTQAFLMNVLPTDYVDVRALLEQAQTLLLSSTKTQIEVDNMTDLLNAGPQGIEDVMNDLVSVSTAKSTLYVKGLPESCLISVYSLNGEMLSSVKSTNNYKRTLESGKYIVSVKGRVVNKNLVVIIK